MAHMANAIDNSTGQFDFQQFLRKRNPYLNQATGLYDTFGGVVSGTNWRNNESRKRNANWGNVSLPGLGTSTASGGAGGERGAPGVSTVRRVKSWPIEGLLGQELDNYGTSRKASAGDLDNYFKTLNQPGNLRDTAQEQGFIGDVFSGKLAGDMRAGRDAYRDEMGNIIGGVKSGLSDIRSRYSTTQTGNIDDLAKQLAGSVAGYRSEAGGLIGDEEAGLNRLLGQYRTAATAKANQGAADAMGSLKAGQAVSGGGRNSMTDRLAIAANQRFQTNLARELADRETGNFAHVSALRRGLTDTATGMGRADIGTVSNRRFNLGDTMAGFERGDLGITSGMETGLSRDLFNAGRDDERFIRGQGNSLLGARANLNRANASDIATGIGLRQNVNDAALRNLGTLANIDQANSWYALDDGGPRWAQTFDPRQMPGRQPMPQPVYPMNDWNIQNPPTTPAWSNPNRVQPQGNGFDEWLQGGGMYGIDPFYAFDYSNVDPRQYE